MRAYGLKKIAGLCMCMECRGNSEATHKTARHRLKEDTIQELNEALEPDEHHNCEYCGHCKSLVG